MIACQNFKIPLCNSTRIYCASFPVALAISLIGTFLPVNGGSSTSYLTSPIQKYMSGKVFYSIDTLELIAEALDCSYDFLLGKSKTPKDDRYYQVILMLLYDGVRISELLDLKKENIHLDEQYFDVIDSKTENGIRKVPIADKVLPFYKN